MIEETIKFHDTLNPDLWEGFELKPVVKKALTRIAIDFSYYVSNDVFKLIADDIVFSGSMANYNYNENSDIDLHIITDYNNYPDFEDEVLDDYFWSKKQLYNMEHKISIYKHPVELYIENKSAPGMSQGKYSILNDKWISKPIKKEIKDIDDIEKLPEYIKLKNSIAKALVYNYTIDEAKETLASLYDYRKKGLDSSEGEFSIENLIFKKLRNKGYIDKLRKYISYKKDESLSLDD